MRSENSSLTELLKQPDEIREGEVGTKSRVVRRLRDDASKAELRTRCSTSLVMGNFQARHTSLPALPHALTALQHRDQHHRKTPSSPSLASPYPALLTIDLKPISCRN